MGKWFYGMSGRRVMDERLAPDFLQQMTRRYGIATLIQIAAVPVAVAAPGRCVHCAPLRRLLPAAAAQAALHARRGTDRRREIGQLAIAVGGTRELCGVLDGRFQLTPRTAL